MKLLGGVKVTSLEMIFKCFFLLLDTLILGFFQLDPIRKVLSGESQNTSTWRRVAELIFLLMSHFLGFGNR